MQISWFNDFIELARTRSFTRAAENRHITHPAFGRRIKALEEWAGVALVERTKPVELTADGVVFLETIVEIVESLRVLQDRLLRGSGDNDIEIRIATGVTISSTFFPLWYKQMCEKVEFFRANIFACSNERAIQALATHEADLLLAYSSHHTRLLIGPARFEWLTIAHERLIPVSPPDKDGRPLFDGRKKMTEPLLAFSPDVALQMIYKRHMAVSHMTPNVHVVHESGSYSSILELASSGLGMAWLPEMLVRDALDNGRLVKIDEADWDIDVDIALYRRKFFRHPIVDRIWSCYDFSK